MNEKARELWGLIHETEEKIEELEGEVEEMMTTLEGIAREQFPDESYVVVGSAWECEDSDVGFCVYNSEEDPCRDSCLVCGEPYERK